MIPANQTQLRLLRRAVKAQQAAHEALDDLRDSLTVNGLNEQQAETLREEVIDLALSPEVINMAHLQRLRDAIYWENP
jgi:hypothetical protein